MEPTRVSDRPAGRDGRLGVFRWTAVVLVFTVFYGLTAQRGVSWQDSGRFQYRVLNGEYHDDLGLALAHGLDIRLHHALRTIQNELFHLGADLSFPQTNEKKTAVPRIEQRHVDALEELIDEINEGLPSLDNFILPGGTQGAAVLQVARAVCRRAERLVVTLAKEEDLNPLNVIYLNRLSDALFVIARFENLQKGAQEPMWDSHA